MDGACGRAQEKKEVIFYMYFPSYRTKKNGVPILGKAEIDAISEKFILDFCPEGMETSMEIDVDSFVINYLGMKQDFQYLSHNGIYLGITVFNDTKKVPVYVPETKTTEYISAKARTVIIDNNLLEEDQEHRYIGAQWVMKVDMVYFIRVISLITLLMSSILCTNLPKFLCTI